MKQLKRSADEMLENVIGVMADPARLESLMANPRQELQKLRDESVKKADSYNYPEDKVLYRIAIIVLGLLSLTAAIGSIVLALSGHPTPEVLVSLGSAAVGALVGLFAKSPTSKD